MVLNCSNPLVCIETLANSQTKDAAMAKMSVKRRFVTLIEMMIVMFLIALITGVIAYNYRGSLEEGKVFKTRTAISKLETILNLEVAKNPEIARSITSNWQTIIRNSPLVHDPQSLITDGWGEPYEVGVDENGAVKVTSRRLTEYDQSHQNTDLQR